MILEVPMYVESSKVDGEWVYRMQGLFEHRLYAEAPSLERATNRMRERLRKAAIDYVAWLRHERMARMLFNRDLIEKRLKLRVELRRRTVTGKFLFVAFREFGKYVAFSPSLRQVWFDLKSPAELELRAVEAWREHLLKEEEDDEDFVAPQGLQGKAWLTTVDISRSTTGPRATPEQQMWAVLGAQEEFDGEVELNRVGLRLRDVCRELDQVVYCDEPVRELTQLLSAHDRRSVAVVGPRRVGKTSVVNEVSRRRSLDPKLRSKDTGHLWRLSPQRLIAGMSYVGQWESRLHAILDRANAKDFTLVFDNALGLFQAGKTMQSSLTVGHVLKRAMQERRVRIVVEMTPEALGRLREMDRPFADMLHLVRLEEPDERTTHLVLIDTMRRLEASMGVRFGLRAVPTVYDLQRRFGRDSAFPGKGCHALTRLAVRAAAQARLKQAEPEKTSKDGPKNGPMKGAKNGLMGTRPTASIDREQALAEFREETGLPLALLDESAALGEAAVRERLGRRFVGQAAATDAAVETFGLLEARLSDTSKPVATMLLVGPTGVGKTQFAKEVARCFFGSPDRLLRFDMNQCITSRSAAHLVGDFHQPDGLLTSAIRRQPFSVVLLDEIEKAHGDVHNMLLQVMGEGRLTDAMGRTCDFTNCILLLTSNLGTARDTAAVGFAQDDCHEEQRVRRVVEQFFRPEFVNRLDRTIVFQRLGREEMSGVARTLLNELFERPGLRQRRSLVDIDDESLEWIIDQGYDPAMGARAIRRAVERQLTSRVSEFLAEAGNDEHVTLIRARRKRGVEGDGGGDARGLDVQSAVIAPAPVAADAAASYAVAPEATLQALRTFVENREERLSELKPGGAIESGKLSAETLRYYELQESLKELLERTEMLAAKWRSQKALSAQPTTRIPLAAKPSRQRLTASGWGKEVDIADKMAHREIEEYLEETDTQRDLDKSGVFEQMEDCVRDAAWIDMLMLCEIEMLDTRLDLRWQATARLSPEERLFCREYTQRIAEVCGAEVLESTAEIGRIVGDGPTGGDPTSSHRRPEPHGVTHGMQCRIVGAALATLLEGEAGWHFIGDGLSALELQWKVLDAASPASLEQDQPADPWVRSNTLVRQYEQRASDVETAQDWTRDGLDPQRVVLPLGIAEMRRELAGRLQLPDEFRSPRASSTSETS